MDNDSLMRRIALATDGQRPLTAAKTTPAPAPAPAPQAARAQAATAGTNSVHSAVAQSQANGEASSYLGEDRRTKGKLARYAPAQQVAAPQPTAQTSASPQAAPAQVTPQQTQQHPAPTQAPAAQTAPQPAPPAQHQNDIISFKAQLDAAYPNSGAQTEELPGSPLGELISCDGTEAVVRGDPAMVRDAISVGEMVILPVGDNSRVIGLAYQLEQISAPGLQDFIAIKIELQGEVRRKADGSSSFSKGIANYPSIGAVAQKIGSADLGALYAASGNLNVVVGHLAQSEEIPAYINVEDMLSKHFAVLGSTGCGKSSSVSLLLRAAQEVVPDLRTLLLDPHSEYSSAFPEANTIGVDRLEMPFWMFQLDEYAEVLFRGQPVVTEEVEALREFIPEAKQKYRDGEGASLRSSGAGGLMTADTAVPYRISDVIALIDAEAGQLEARFERNTLKSLKARIMAHGSDPRYRFMFRDKTISDKAEETLDFFFNLRGQTGSMTIIQMAGMPSEVVNAVASVLCRLAFELCIAAKGKMKILMVCEEAHRYIPADLNGGFEPTRRAIARIAKEGRKYGAFISIISQRPAELDPTILSQCSTIFSLRLSNEHDQELIRKAISNSSKSTISFLSSLANREAIAFGEGLSTPMRLRFRTMPQHWLPGKDIDVFDPSNHGTAQAGSVFRNWRGVAGLSPNGRILE